MKSVLVTIAPAIEALTSRCCPACSAVSAMTSSVRLPSVAFRSPPKASPVRSATASVARLSSAASGAMARIDKRKSSVPASGQRCSPASASGTKTSSQSSGVLRISPRRRFTWRLLAAAGIRT